MSDKNNWRGWSQGYFVDQKQYSNWTQEAKNEANYREGFLVRPTSTGNAICKAVSHDDAIWIAQRLNKAAELEQENKTLRESIEAALRISDLWLPAHADAEHAGEAEALHKMRNQLLEAIAQNKE